MVCLETSFLIDLLRERKGARELAQQLSRETRLTVAAPSVMEVWSGACLSNASDAEKHKVTELLQSVEILPLDERSAKWAAELEYSLSTQGTSMQLADVQIAAIAQANGEMLVTRDEDFSRIAGLKLLKY
jgi:tRNA(fMet)-specific endonuclease VapC